MKCAKVMLDSTDSMMESSVKPRKRKGLVFGVGVNDAGFATSMKLNGRSLNHSAYTAWFGMLNRSYNEGYKKNKPSYNGCTVSEKWLVFSSFYEWWKVNHVYGWHLDKDIISPGNLIYDESSCVYVPPEINSFVTFHDSARGDLPVGVCFHKQHMKFHAKINNINRRVHLGYFSDPIEAHKAWYKRKIEMANEYKSLCDRIHPRLFDGLIAKIDSVKEF